MQKIIPRDLWGGFFFIIIIIFLCNLFSFLLTAKLSAKQKGVSLQKVPGHILIYLTDLVIK